MSLGSTSLFFNKAAGEDDIPSDLWNVRKASLLHSVSSKFDNGNLGRWSCYQGRSRSTIFPMLKKGSLAESSNYKDISLSDIASKVPVWKLIPRL